MVVVPPTLQNLIKKKDLIKDLNKLLAKLINFIYINNEFWINKLRTNVQMIRWGEIINVIFMNTVAIVMFTLKKSTLQLWHYKK